MIVLADASPTSRRTLRNTLSMYASEQMAEVSSGLEALALTASPGAYVVLTGTTLQDMSGIALCRQLRRRRAQRHIPVLLLAEDRTPEAVLQAVDHGVDTYIVLPYEDGPLIQKVRQAVDRARQLADPAAHKVHYLTRRR